MVNAVFVDIDDTTAIDATDPATMGVIYRVYNGATYDLYVSDGVKLVPMDDVNNNFATTFLLMGS